jgi:hypothetical protein
MTFFGGMKSVVHMGAESLNYSYLRLTDVRDLDRIVGLFFVEFFLEVRWIKKIIL